MDRIKLDRQCARRILNNIWQVKLHIVVMISCVLLSQLYRHLYVQNQNQELLRDAISNVQDDVRKYVNGPREPGQELPEFKMNPNQVQDLKHIYKNVQKSLKHLEKSSEKYDLASIVSGGSIDSTYDTKLIFPKNLLYKSLNYLGVIPVLSRNPARNMINPSMAPGNCFAFKGDKGAVSIQLARKAYLRSVTIEHIEQRDPGTISNAPRVFSISGLKYSSDPKPFHLGTFVFDISDGTTSETFELSPKAVESYQHVKVEFMSNHGANATCVYRLQVHGLIA